MIINIIYNFDLFFDVLKGLQLLASKFDANAGLNKLYQEHHQWLVRWIARRSPNWDCAQDLAQDTFIRLLNRPQVIETIQSPRSWLAKIANNLLVDQARRQLLEKNYLAMLATLPEAEQPSCEEQWLVFSLLAQIDKLLDGLRSIEKQAFLMARLEGISYRNIATELEVSLSSVEKYIAKAMLQCYKASYLQEY